MLQRGLALVALMASLVMSSFAHADVDWGHFKARFLMADGRVIDTGNNNVSHTEGQGFGMLFALAGNDRDSFDKMWTWTDTHLKNPKNGLFYWRYNPVAPDPIEDKNDASDGDVLIAWALLKAGEKWGDPKYLKASDAITNALIKHTVIDFAGKKIMLPGASGFNLNSYVNLNPSYFVFPAWRAFAKRSHLAVWTQLINDGQSLLKKMGWGEANLPTDWVSLYADGRMEPAKQWPARMSYDAIRIPMYIGWDQPNSVLLEPWRTWFGRYDRLHTPAWVNVNDNQEATYNMQGGLLAIRDLTMGTLTSMETEVTSQDDYYSASLKLLAAMAAQGM